MIDVAALATQVLVSLVVVLIVRALWWLLSSITTRWQERQIERRYPLVGVYATTFEDYDDAGEPVRRAAQLDITYQRGRVMRGTTQVGARGWELSGQILDSGFLSGQYRALAPNDPGHGFFLVEHIHGTVADYEGMWMGYAPGTRRVEGGGYVWRRRR